MGLMREKNTCEYKVRQQDRKVEGPGEGYGSPGEEGTAPPCFAISPQPPPLPPISGIKIHLKQPSQN